MRSGLSSERSRVTVGYDNLPQQDEQDETLHSKIGGVFSNPPLWDEPEDRRVEKLHATQILFKLSQCVILHQIEIMMWEVGRWEDA